MKHIPVLLESVLKTLGDINGKTVVDCTFGNGGYSKAFLDAGANVIAFDRDSNVISTANEFSKKYGDKFQFINKPFSSVGELPDKYDAIVFDLGISSMQIDSGERGFSFRFDGPLDMRMGNNGKTAAELIKDSTVHELAKILSNYGDVKKAMPISYALKNALPETTFALRDLIFNPKDVAPVFQALRIAVNDELGEVETALSVVPDLLKVNGICACVTFHSLEDRLVKSTFREWTTPLGDPRLPQVIEPKFKLLKTYRPSDDELDNNPRSRSAHLRSVLKSY
jgi:16S rRNA (cytosine1402-N4)-methyltransferase